MSHISATLHDVRWRSRWREIDANRQTKREGLHVRGIYLFDCWLSWYDLYIQIIILKNHIRTFKIDFNESSGSSSAYPPTFGVSFAFTGAASPSADMSGKVLGGFGFWSASIGATLLDICNVRVLLLMLLVLVLLPTAVRVWNRLGLPGSVSFSQVRNGGGSGADMLVSFNFRSIRL